MFTENCLSECDCVYILNQNIIKRIAFRYQKVVGHLWVKNNCSFAIIIFTNLAWTFIYQACAEKKLRYRKEIKNQSPCENGYRNYWLNGNSLI